MRDLKLLKFFLASLLLGLIIFPQSSYSRVNSLTGGLGVSYDYSDRSYDSDVNNDSDYQRFVLTPLVKFTSISERDSFQLRAAPRIKYDLDNYETDWDNDLNVSADRYMVKSWQLGVRNSYRRSDYYLEDTSVSSQPAEPLVGTSELSDPQLTTDLGRRRFWQNKMFVYSNHFYHEESSIRVGFNYDVLRNDDSGVGGYEDYDRYVASLVNRHRFTPAWKTNFELRYVVGDYNRAAAAEQLSNDLEEYRLLLGVDNQSIPHNPLSLDYYYIGTQYDEILRDDSDIHQVRFTWRRDYTPHLYTRLGLGPSYGKTEGQDANWGGNGTAEIDYRIEHGFFNFKLDKIYNVKNFSGNNERGFVDSWFGRLKFGYELIQRLTASGELSYLYEDREDLISGVVFEEGISNQLEEYHKDRYIARAGLGYNFWQNYTASIGYTFTKQESERLGEDYDDHRLLLTLSWGKELYRW